MSPNKRQAITWNNDDRLHTRSLGMNCSDIWIKTHELSLMKIYLKMPGGGVGGWGCTTALAHNTVHMDLQSLLCEEWLGGLSEHDSLKTWHDAKVAVTDGTTGYRCDKLRWRQWRQCCHDGNSFQCCSSCYYLSQCRKISSTILSMPWN